MTLDFKQDAGFGLLGKVAYVTFHSTPTLGTFSLWSIDCAASFVQIV